MSQRANQRASAEAFVAEQKQQEAQQEEDEDDEAVPVSDDEEAEEDGEEEVPVGSPPQPFAWDTDSGSTGAVAGPAPVRTRVGSEPTVTTSPTVIRIGIDLMAEDGDTIEGTISAFVVGMSDMYMACIGDDRSGEGKPRAYLLTLELVPKAVMKAVKAATNRKGSGQRLGTMEKFKSSDFEKCQTKESFIEGRKQSISFRDDVQRRPSPYPPPEPQPNTISRATHPFLQCAHSCATRSHSLQRWMVTKPGKAQGFVDDEDMKDKLISDVSCLRRTAGRITWFFTSFRFAGRGSP